MLNHFILLLPCFVCFFWGITLIFNFKMNYRAQNVLAINLLITAILFYLYGSYFTFDGDYSSFWKEDIFFTFCQLLLYPLCMLYFRLLTDERKLRWWSYLSLLPAIILGGGSFIGYMIMGDEKADLYARDVLIKYTDIKIPDDPIYHIQYLLNVWLFNIVVILQLIYLLIYASISLIRYKKKLNEFYSHIEGKCIENSYFILICVAFITLLSIYALERHKDVSTSLWQISTIFIGYSVAFYIIAYSGYHLRYTAEDLGELMEKADLEAKEFDENRDEFIAADEKTTDKRSYNPKLVSHFIKLIEDDKVYLQSDLRLDEIAQMLRTNRCYISRLINDEYNCTFSEYVNRMRIAYAQQIMRNDPTILQETVATQSGFLYSTTFSRTFKRQTGMTPGEWIKSV